MKIDSFEKLYAEQLADLYSAEGQLCDALPKMADAATDDELKMALQDHLEQTVVQRDRIEKLLAGIDGASRSHVCAAMQGLIEEGEGMIESVTDPEVRDAGLIAAAQRVEHYEIAAYGTVIEFARILGREDDVPALEQTLGEEKEANNLLTKIATNAVNQAAAAAA